MSMQSYGNCELKANITKINENYNLKELWDKMQKLTEKTDATPQEIVYDQEDDIEEIYILRELKSIMKDYITQVWIKLKIDIYPTYIDSEAEGTDLQGQIVWCIEPELIDPVKSYSARWFTWSTFG